MKFVIDFSNIATEKGVPIALTGLLIVFVALALISIAIALLPRVLKLLEPILPKPHIPHKKATATTANKGSQDLLIAAAAASAYHGHQKKHGGTSPAK